MRFYFGQDFGLILTTWFKTNCLESVTWTPWQNTLFCLGSWAQLWRGGKKVKAEKELAVACKEYGLDSYIVSFIVDILTGSEGACFILSFIRAEERFKTQDTRNCIGTEKGRMLEDGNSAEEGNLASCLYMCVYVYMYMCVCILI